MVGPNYLIIMALIFDFALEAIFRYHPGRVS